MKKKLVLAAAAALLAGPVLAQELPQCVADDVAGPDVSVQVPDGTQVVALWRQHPDAPKGVGVYTNVFYEDSATVDIYVGSDDPAQMAVVTFATDTDGADHFNYHFRGETPEMIPPGIIGGKWAACRLGASS